MHEKYLARQAQANAAQQEKKNEKKGEAFVTIEDEDWFKEVTFMTTDNVEPIFKFNDDCKSRIVMDTGCM